MILTEIIGTFITKLNPLKIMDPFEKMVSYYDELDP
jgi:hypothetical protein